MPNHVHLIVTPATSHGLSRAIGEAHRRYTAYINARERVTGHLFQARFNSVAMDEAHCLAALRYVAMNPVRANLVTQPAAWPWASTRTHLTGEADGLVDPAPVRELVSDYAAFLEESPDAALVAALRTGQSIGRPLMSDDRLKVLESLLNRRLRPRRRGPKPRQGQRQGGQKDLDV